MATRLEELKQHAAEIKKQIELLESKSDEVIDAFFAELEMPGTYMKFGDSWVIKPKGKYRQATKKSVELNGLWFIPCSSYVSALPSLIEWNSGGYAVKDFRERLKSGRIKVYHKPGAIMSVVNKSFDNLCEYSLAMERIANKCEEVHPDFEWDWPKINRMKHEQLTRLVIETFNGRIFKHQVRGEYSDGYVEYFAFRVVDFDDGSYVVKCSKLHKWFNEHNEEPLPELTENDIFKCIRLTPFDTDVSKELYSLIKNRLNKAEPATVDEWRAIACEHKNNVAKMNDIRDTIRVAIGLEPMKKLG